MQILGNVKRLLKICERKSAGAKKPLSLSVKEENLQRLQKEKRRSRGRGYLFSAGRTARQWTFWGVRPAAGF
jgi:hypothetical protein